MKYFTLQTHFIRLFLLFSGLLCLFFNPMEAAAKDPRETLQFYITGLNKLILPKDDVRAEGAYQIFERMRAVFGISGKERLPALNVTSSMDKTLLLLLPDGDIVLSKGFIDVCHQQADIQVAKACLAFALGHELSHWMDNNSRRQRVYLLPPYSPASPFNPLSTCRDQKKEKKELQADRNGFIYAGIEGYSVNLLLGTNFFESWLQRAENRCQQTHPNLKERVILLKSHLDELRKKLNYFNFGVRLSHFNQCSDGIHFFHMFKDVFPAPEVLNNLGFCYLRQALKDMDDERAYFYWMPLILDMDTRAAHLRSRRTERKIKKLKQAAIDGKAEASLQLAEKYLKQAAAYPKYLPARLNLAVSFLYRGKPRKAIKVLKEAAGLEPNNLHIQGIMALALYEQSDAATALQRLKELEKLAARTDAPLNLSYNVASIYESRSNSAKARPYWKSAAQASASLPAQIRKLVCDQKDARNHCSEPLGILWKSSSLNSLLPLKFKGRWITLSRQRNVYNKVKNWPSVSFDEEVNDDEVKGTIYVNPNSSVELLLLDDFPQMMVLKEHYLSKLKPLELEDECVQPVRKRVIAQGVLQFCNDLAILKRGGAIREVWVNGNALIYKAEIKTVKK